jgi:hypothetical protein
MKSKPLFLRLALVMAISVVPQYLIADAGLLSIGAFIAGIWLSQTLKDVIILGGFGSALPWLALAFWLDVGNEHILSSRIAELFHVPGYGFVLFITFVLPFLSGTITALSGYYLQLYFQKS